MKRFVVSGQHLTVHDREAMVESCYRGRVFAEFDSFREAMAFRKVEKRDARVPRRCPACFL